jgi:quinol monooxygenase YgiN
VHVDCEDPLRLVFIEQWVDRTALQDHFGVPASREFVRALQPLFAAPATLETTTPHGWKNYSTWQLCHANYILQCNIRGTR